MNREQITFKTAVLFMAVLVTAFALIAGSLIVAGGQGALTAIGVDVEVPIVQLVLSTVLLQGVAFGGTALAFFYAYQRAFDDGIEYRSLREFVLLRRPTDRQFKLAVLGFAAAFVVTMITSVVSQMLGIEPGTNQILTVAEQQPVSLLMMVVLSILVVAPGEELLFRGVIQGHIREGFSPVATVILASALFATTHVGSVTGSGTLVSIVSIFGIGLILGALYEYTDNLTVPILAHGFYNATQFALVYVALL